VATGYASSVQPKPFLLQALAVAPVDFPAGLPRPRTRQSNRALTHPVTSPHRVLIAVQWRRNVDRLSIAYAFRPRLRPG
jgi:hypothetical protein